MSIRSVRRLLADTYDIGRSIGRVESLLRVRS